MDMQFYKLENILQIRKDERPAQDNKPFEDDYWGKLIIKGHKDPHTLNRGEAFELGRLCQRLFSITVDKGQNALTMEVVGYTRRLNSMLG